MEVEIEVLSELRRDLHTLATEELDQSDDSSLRAVEQMFHFGRYGAFNDAATLLYERTMAEIANQRDEKEREEAEDGHPLAEADPMVWQFDMLELMGGLGRLDIYGANLRHAVCVLAQREGKRPLSEGDRAETCDRIEELLSVMRVTDEKEAATTERTNPDD